MSGEGYMQGDGVARVALDVRGVTKRYSDTVAIGPISFTVSEGEFFSLLGPSGCGKSTTLRCIAGFEQPTAGEIHLKGERLDIKPPYKRDLGLVFQTHALFPHLTVAGNVGFGLTLRKLPVAEVKSRVAWALELVGLMGLEARMPSQISGGQQQRVALARSLVLKPPLLLLDEPLSSLDLKLRQQMRDELRTLQRQLGQTTVFVTHDQTEALALSDRIAVLSNGRIEQIGTPMKIYRSPASRFVADFIGQSNILTARVEGQNGAHLMLKLEGGPSLLARAPAGSAWRAGDQVWAIVRPEDIAFRRNGAAAQTELSGRVRDVEYLGEDTQVRIDVPGLPGLLVAFKTTRAASAQISSPDVLLHVDADDVYILGR